MLVRLIKQLFLFIESELNWFKDEDLQTNLIISEAEFNEIKAAYIDSLLQEQGTITLTDELFKAAGISAEQFDLGDY
jgi:hypothetical protein